VTASKTTYCFLPRPERASHERKDSEIRKQERKKEFQYRRTEGDNLLKKAQKV
jgi:hypothetical protein